MVRRQRRPPDPADHRPALGRASSRPPRSAATPRGACTPCASARSRPSSASRRSTPATGIRSSPRARRPTPSCACTSARRRRCRRPRPTRRSRWRRRSASTTRWRRSATSCSPACSCASPTLKLAYSRGPDRLAALRARTRRRRVARAPAWGGVKDLVPEPPSTYYYRHVYGCFFKDRHGTRVARPASASTTSRSRPTTRTPTRRGRTVEGGRGAASWATSTDDVVYKILRGNAIRMLSLDLV